MSQLQSAPANSARAPDAPVAPVSGTVARRFPTSKAFGAAARVKKASASLSAGSLAGTDSCASCGDLRRYDDSLTTDAMRHVSTPIVSCSQVKHAVRDFCDTHLLSVETQLAVNGLESGARGIWLFQRAANARGGLVLLAIQQDRPPLDRSGCADDEPRFTAIVIEKEACGVRLDARVAVFAR